MRLNPFQPFEESVENFRNGPEREKRRIMGRRKERMRIRYNL